MKCAVFIKITHKGVDISWHCKQIRLERFWLIGCCVFVLLTSVCDGYDEVEKNRTIDHVDNDFVGDQGDDDDLASSLNQHQYEHNGMNVAALLVGFPILSLPERQK